MHGRDHLSEGLRLIVDIGHDSNWTLNLSDVDVGSVVEISFGEESKLSKLAFEIIKKAGKGFAVEERATGKLVDCTLEPDEEKSFEKAGFTKKPIGIECELLWACTRNPHHPMRGTMMHIHCITVGRHFAWGILYPNNQADLWCFPKLVTGIKVVSKTEKT